MLRINARRFAAATFAALLGTCAHGAPVSYVLDLSDRLPDGPAYLEVTITEGTGGAIEFTVEAQAALLAHAGDGLEIRAFGFNTGGRELTSRNFSGLPDSFRVHGSTRMDGFGRFDVTLLGNGPERVESLAFSIVGVDGDTPESYLLPSAETAGGSGAPFAARVRGLIGDSAGCNPDRKCTPVAIPTAFLGASPVPVPAGAWLGATALVAAARFARRRPARRA
jgi:hypothetical protein